MDGQLFFRIIVTFIQTFSSLSSLVVLRNYKIIRLPVTTIMIISSIGRIVRGRIYQYSNGRCNHQFVRATLAFHKSLPLIGYPSLKLNLSHCKLWYNFHKHKSNQIIYFNSVYFFLVFHLWSYVPEYRSALQGFL